ncbi:hypothetical protein GCM10022409_03460 [Hymenobacter glaciei]|uniref:Phage abortive infection protein n=1 Tax=Hymenobacter glaciei TaxID=877209 RepID=A0ABP7T9K0_9BACT
MISNKTTQFFAWFLVVIGTIVLIYFLFSSRINDYHVPGFFNHSNQKKETIDFTATGQFGDFVGGVVGTIFTLAGTLLIFLSFQEQAKQNSRESFESSFFEMVRLHRENISELSYNYYLNNKSIRAENREVFRIIFSEFTDCYREVKKFSNSDKPLDYITPQYLKTLQTIINNNKIKANPIELCLIDISYQLTYFGIEEEGEIILRNKLKDKYNNHYLFRLLLFIKLKPKNNYKDPLARWKGIRHSSLKDLRLLIDELYDVHRNKVKSDSVSPLAQDFINSVKFSRYYEGHQHRLGHYFRHLFQSFKYVDTYPDLDNSKRYLYAKMLRAQLSTYEQALLFANSVSTLGHKWEYIPDSQNSKVQSTYNGHLLTKYQIIKNLPGSHSYGITYRRFYPNIKFESEE